MQRLHLAGLLLVGCALVLRADTHYVRSPETCTNTAAQSPYTSWETAATNIQWAMDAASADDAVLVSNGVYRAAGTVNNVVAFEKDLTLSSVNGPADTVIDGQDAARCVWLRYRSTLDGFTLSNGFAACGAGVYMQNSTGTVTNCWMVDNVCTGVTSSFTAGAGLALDGGNPLATDCKIWNNECRAGDISSGYGSAHGGGGGVCIITGLVQCCFITGNKSLYIGAAGNNSGGGVFIRGGVVSNCTIAGNVGRTGGGIRTSLGVPGMIVDCSISNNVAIDIAAGASLQGGIIIGGSVSSNAAARYAGLYLSRGAMVSNCLVSLNTSTSGAWNGVGVVMLLNDEGSLVTDCVISGNFTSLAGTGAGGGVSCYYPQNRVVNSSILNNTSHSHGGGVYIYGNNAPGGGTVSNCIISGNASTNYYGGGVYMIQGGTLRNCLIYSNQALRAGGVYLVNGYINTSRVSGCTIVANRTTTSYAGGMIIDNSNEVFNCIIASNTISDGSLKDLVCIGAGSETISYSCAPEAPLVRGNINTAPDFADFAGQNYRLLPGSPGIDAGTNETWMAGAVELNGRSRIDRFIRRVDMGCYEYLSQGALFGVR